MRVPCHAVRSHCLQTQSRREQSGLRISSECMAVLFPIPVTESSIRGFTNELLEFAFT